MSHGAHQYMWQMSLLRSDVAGCLDNISVISKYKFSAELVTQFYKGNNLWFFKGKYLELLG